MIAEEPNLPNDLLSFDPSGAEGVPDSVGPVVNGASPQSENVGGQNERDQAPSLSEIDLTAQEGPAPVSGSQGNNDGKDEGSGKDVPTAASQSVAAPDLSEEPAMHQRRAEIRRDAFAALDVLFSRQMVLTQRTLIADTLAVTDGTALGSIAGLSDESEKLTVRVKRMVSSLDVEDDCHYWKAEDGSGDRSKKAPALLRTMKRVLSLGRGRSGYPDVHSFLGIKCLDCNWSPEVCLQTALVTADNRR
ncbi:hypothetical protein BGX34_000763 [Mortierella sp. NVP85]|nr:hypothetical protein BGX34_000763 [Mortierella sp. NVP85]